MSVSPHPSPLGIVGGSSFLEGEGLVGAGIEGRLEVVETQRGGVVLRRADDVVFLRRHGEDGYRPPHRIPHHAHVLALQAMGVEAVVGFASAGSLEPNLSPGRVVVPDDYLSRHPPPTFAGDEYLHIVPTLDEGLRGLLLETAREVVGDTVVPSGVYAETRGPRFETRAEVRSLARDASLVGMTCASEATLCQERGLRYAMICIVDNWAHGLGPEALTLQAFRDQQTASGRLARALLGALVRRWRERQPSRDTR
jgi:5'-methylthioadenosine phosphorylase